MDKTCGQSCIGAHDAQPMQICDASFFNQIAFEQLRQNPALLARPRTHALTVMLAATCRSTRIVAFLALSVCMPGCACFALSASILQCRHVRSKVAVRPERN